METKEKTKEGTQIFEFLLFNYIYVLLLQTNKCFDKIRHDIFLKFSNNNTDKWNMGYSFLEQNVKVNQIFLLIR